MSKKIPSAENHGMGSVPARSAHGLISKDRAVPRLRRRCAPLFRVMTPGEAVHPLLPAVDAAA